MSDLVEIQNHGSIREIRLARAPVNALNTDLCRALIAALDAAVGEGMRGVVLSGGAKVFSAGLDVPHLMSHGENREALQDSWHAFFGATRALAELRIPVVAALTGHSPGVGGKDLCAYLLSGCLADHEAVGYAEGLEKLRRGSWLMMRAGAASNDLPALAPLVIENPLRAARCMVVSDDLTPTAILQDGYMDAKMRAMCSLGIDPLVALRMVTLSPAEYFGLPRRGGIAPGWLADMVLVDSLESCRVERVWKAGKLVAQAGQLCQQLDRKFAAGPAMSKQPLSPATIRLVEQPGKTKIRLIGWQKGSLLTESLTAAAKIVDDAVVADPGQDIAKLVVQERNGNSGEIAVGFVKGLGLRRGALGASVAHDAHPFVVAGADDLSILTALAWLREQGGGLVACEGEKILACLSLPVAGLMSDSPLAVVAGALKMVDQAAGGLGVIGDHPCMALSFLSLSVIPSLKLTDQGYVDLGQGGRQDLFV